MGFLLGSLQASIFMASLGEDLIPMLKSSLCNWKRYLIDTHIFAESRKIELILKKLESYHLNNSVTLEPEKNNEINYLDVLIKRLNNSKWETSVYQKPTSADVCINWNAHTSTKGK